MMFGDHAVTAEALALRIADNLGIQLVSAGVPFVGKNKPWTDALRRILQNWGDELGMETHHQLATKGTENKVDPAVKTNFGRQ
jgi:hypothetical protein